MKLFPLFADLAGKTVFVVGGGDVATRKTRLLRAAGAQVRLWSRAVDAALVELASQGSVQIMAGEFDAAWLDDCWLMVVATDDAQVNADFAALAVSRRLWVNVVDDAATSTFHVPAIVDRAPLTIAISSSGVAPMLARHLREKLETLFDPAWGHLAAWFEQNRARIKATLPELAARRRWFDTILSGDISALFDPHTGKPDHARLERLLENTQTTSSASTVCLMGAGTGAQADLTLAGLRQLNLSDLVLCEDIVPESVMALARRDAQVHYAPFDRQDWLDRLLREARTEPGRHLVAVRLGSGFDDEAGRWLVQALRAHDLACVEVPGVPYPIMPMP